MSKYFDLLVLGAGSGGIAAARRAAEYGARVGIVEFSHLGGTCVNRGCVPKKLMVYASQFPSIFTDAPGYGWSPVTSTLDWEKMTAAVNGEVHRLNGVYAQMLERSQVEVFHGHGAFINPHQIQIGEELVTTDKVLIAVGGHPVVPNIPGIEYAITSDDIFTLPEQPQRLVVIGGGYIGSEFACIFQGFGSEVIQVIRGEQILRGFDEDLRQGIRQGMEHHGIQLINKATPMSLEKTEAGVTLVLAREDGATDLVIADAVALAAVGRKPRTENLGLEHTKVQLSHRAVVVDEYSRTTVDHIYAVGDCTDHINLTPVAINEGRAFADTVYGGKSRLMSYEYIPTAIFTTPQAATVGLTEAEAEAKHPGQIKIYRSRFRPMYYTLAGKQEQTMMKLVVHTETDQVLGAHMVGDYAAEIIQGVAIALKMGATKANFDATVGIHPTSAEEFVTMR